MKRLVPAFLAAAVTFSDAVADPYAGYIYPAGIQAGTTKRFVIGGQKMWSVNGMYFGRKGLRVLDIERVPGFVPPTGMQRRHLRNWLDGIAGGVRDEPPEPADPHRSEWRSNTWWSVLGDLDPLEISIVERYLFTRRNPLQEAPSLSQMTIVTIAADANAEPGVCDMSIWNGRGISVPRPFVVTEHPHVDEPLFTAPHRERPGPAFADVTRSGVVLNGQIMPGETDSFRIRFGGGKRYSVKVTARELQPYIGDAVPGFFNPEVVIRNGAGQIVAGGDDSGRFRPDPDFVFVPPSSGTYLLEVHDVLFRGRADFVYSVCVEPCRSPERPARKKSVKREKAPPGGFAFGGTVSKPGEVCRCEFTVGKKGPRVLEVTARRNGSPLDAVLTLRRKPDGKHLARWDDVTNTVFVGTVPQGECDPVGFYDFTETGRYVAEVTDRTGHGGDGYFWNLEIRPPEPGFEVYSTRSTLPLRRGRTLKTDFVIVRKEGFEGPVTIVFPEGVRARDNTATAGVDRITVQATYVGKKAVGLQPVKITAKGQIGGRSVSREVVPCDEHEQAFAWKHLVPARSFVMQTAPEKGIRGRKPRSAGGKPGKARKNK